MQFFERLADRVEELTADCGFSEASRRALEELPPCEHVSMEEIISWVCSAEKLPVQRDLDSTFGDPALTIAHRGDFYIQVLYWRDGTTTIHEHAFAGAFTVHSGCSVHVRYDFAVADDSTPYFVRGRLSHRGVELLRAGDVRIIEPGPAGIHSVFHLDRPTLSIVVRTLGDSARRQLAYTPTLGIDPFRRHPETLRKLQHLDFIADCLPATLQTTLESMLRSADICQSYALLEWLLVRSKSMAALAPYLDLVSGIHGERAAGISESLAHTLRTGNVIARRALVQSPEHRLFLALLMIVPDRQGLLEIASSRYPDTSPAEGIVNWLRELSLVSVDPEWGPNPLGVELGEEAVAFLAAIIAGVSVDEAVALATEDPRQQAVLALTLPRTSILTPLFR